MVLTAPGTRAYGRGFFDAKSHEHAQLDYLRLPLVQGLQTLKRFVYEQQLVLRIAAGGLRLVQGH
jgi:hypothetical protein